MFGPDLPRPVAGRLTLYLLGPGVGESIVIVLPDGAGVVVDACVRDGKTLPVELLAHLGISNVPLFVLTHPDLDHVRGAAEVLRRFSPRNVWCYPLSNSLRDVFVDFCRSRTEKAYAELAESLEAIEAHQDRTGRVMEANYGARVLQLGPVEIRSLAPTHFDQGRLRRVWQRVLKARGGPQRYFEGVLRGRTRLGDAPNVLSVALVVSFGGIRVVLGGDVMNGNRSQFSGWKGILRLLVEDGQSGLVTDVAVVKVAHHGSRHSFEPALWNLHAKSVRPIALIAPFSPRLPDPTTLTALSTRAERLLLSAASPELRGRVEGAGWRPSPVVATLSATRAPCVVVDLASSNTLLHASAVSAGYDSAS